MEMDGAEGGAVAAAVFSPPRTPDSEELESTLTDRVFLCLKKKKTDRQTFISFHLIWAFLVVIERKQSPLKQDV